MSIGVRSIIAGGAALLATAGLAGASPALADGSVSVTKVSPSVGGDSGGETVTIDGSGFWCGTGGQTVQDPATGNNDPNPNDYMSVFFGGNAATVNGISSDNEMQVTTPAGEGTVDVVAKCVAGSTGQSATTKADRYTYINSVSGASAGGGGGSGTGDNLGNSASGPTSLAQTGGGPGARPVAAVAAPAWGALLFLVIAAVTPWARRRVTRR